MGKKRRNPWIILLVSVLLLLPRIAQSQQNSEPLDTEHIFGFTEGADIGEKGEKELENTTIGSLGTMIGSYAFFQNETSFRYGVAEHFRASLGVLTDYYSIRYLPGLDDRTGLGFGGTTSEFRWQVLERDRSPIDLTLSLAPQWQRIDTASGKNQQSYIVPFTILADMALLPDTMFAASNIIWNPTFTPSRGKLQEESPLELSLASSGLIGERIWLGAEIRHLTRNQAGFFTGHALFIGPSLFVQLSETVTAKLAWSAQIPDETTGRVDPVNYPRNQVLAQIVKNF